MSDDDEQHDQLDEIRRGWRRGLVSTSRLALAATRLAARRVAGAQSDADGGVERMAKKQGW